MENLVGLAAKDTLGNMSAGLSITVDQPFAVGDRVEILDIANWGDAILLFFSRNSHLER